MLGRVKTCAVTGLDAMCVDVEVHVRSAQQSHFIIVGLGDSAVREAKERVWAALRQTGFSLPEVIVVNLAPAEVRKEGSGFDLPIALGVLTSSGQLNANNLAERMFIGELSLDGRVRPIRGALAATITALQAGIREIVVPAENYHEARLVSGIEVIPVASLAELLAFFETGVFPDLPTRIERGGTEAVQHKLLVSDVWGQESAKRALVIAAAGGHNLLMIGPPGCGKSMLAERYGSLLPRLRQDEMLEVIKIHSIAGQPIEPLFSGQRPFRSPHHIVSDAGLIGGGSVPRPGEISLAHHGVLFLDEFPEYRRSAIEALRAPMEKGEVQVTRAKSSVKFPARFQLIAAMNPCPCGRLGIGEQEKVVGEDKRCSCSRNAVFNYLKKISQPILDRIDLHCELSAVPIQALSQARIDSGSGAVKTGVDDLTLRRMVCAARERQEQRSGRLNAVLSTEEVKQVVKLDSAAEKILERALAKNKLSARGYTKVLKVARTVADLDGAEVVGARCVAEALGFRNLEVLERYCAGAH